MCGTADGWIFIKPSHNFECQVSRTFEIMIPDCIDINSPLTEEQISVERKVLLRQLNERAFLQLESLVV